MARIYTQYGSIYDKPFYCKYDPYTGIWEE